MTTGVIYARVSSIGDRQSTERQVKDLSEYAKYKGIEVCKVFEEHISGAKKNDERPVLCEAMEYCKANRIGCAQLERDNISFRLQSGRKRYIENGGKLGRKVGSVKTEEQIRTEYREVISLLRKGYSIRDVAKLSGKGVSTVQRVKIIING